MTVLNVDYVSTILKIALTSNVMLAQLISNMSKLVNAAVLAKKLKLFAKSAQLV
jgi:hypothetical protein